MIFQNLTAKFFAASALICSSFVFTACDKNSNEEPYDRDIDESGMKRVMLVYAVNHSSLKYDFKNDSIEITRAMQGVDLRYNQVLVHKTVDKGTTALYKFVRNKDGKNEFSKVKEYVRSETSTSPAKVEKVIEDALSLYPNAQYDLVFWGHGTAWRPDDADHSIKSGPQRAYGGEYNGGLNASGNPETDYVNVDDLADAVPDHKFDNIWFDCCYMSSVEVIYEFRNKCNTFVGYPTEVLGDGMAYDKVLPYLVCETPDIKAAATAFFNDYNEKSAPVTIAVIDMKKLEPLAQVARDIIQDGISYPSISDMINYSRMSNCKLVDFITYYRAIASANGEVEKFDDLMAKYDDMVLYHATSDIDFNYHTWDVNKIYCLSSAYIKSNDDNYSSYYRKLDWYNRVFK